MRVYLAMSCLQGRPMAAAFDELAALGADGVQLTPGNAPTEAFEAHARATGVPTRTHHGFTPRAMRTPVWSETHALMGAWDSVHPPRGADAAWLPEDAGAAVLETMYHGYPLGSGDALEAAMECGIALAVDVSHLFMQREQRVLSDATWRRVQEYPRIAELHVSANDGRRDAHAPVTADTFGLDWARARSRETGAPLILECYMHKLSDAERRQQIALVRGEL